MDGRADRRNNAAFFEKLCFRDGLLCTVGLTQRRNKAAFFKSFVFMTDQCGL